MPSTICAFPPCSISIHVPREGHDKKAAEEAKAEAISIHVPREGHDKLRPRAGDCATTFQSTCPARGTTNVAPQSEQTRSHFNPRAPRGARPMRAFATIAGMYISIHVPREGHD